jgi:hypothetical protein
MLQPIVAALMLASDAYGTVAATTDDVATPQQAVPVLTPANPQPQSNTVPSAGSPLFKSLNYEEDYAELADVDRRKSLWTKLKYIPLGGAAYMTLGGELRLRPEYGNNQRWGRGLQDTDGDFQQRTRVWTDLHLDSNLRFFVDLQHATSSNFDAGGGITEEGRLDFHQAFVEASTKIQNAEVSLRIGRQEISLGANRLFDIREGANTRQAFDVARLLIRKGRWDGGIMGGWTVREDVASFNDATNHDYGFYGAHVGRTGGAGSKTSRVEFVWIAAKRKVATFGATGPGRDDRDNFAIRFSGKVELWDYDFEAIGQRGSFADLKVRAQQLSAVVSRGLGGAWSPRVGLRIEQGSGDRDPTDKKMGAFGQLFPRAQTYNGDLGLQNLTYIQPGLIFQPVRRLTVDLTAAALWRTSVHDAVYAQSGQVLRGASESDARFIGWRTTASGRYAITPFITLGAYLNFTAAGKMIRKTGEKNGMLYVAPYLTFRF